MNCLGMGIIATISKIKKFKFKLLVQSLRKEVVCLRLQCSLIDFQTHYFHCTALLSISLDPSTVYPCFRPLDLLGLFCIPFLSHALLDFSLFHPIQLRDSFCGTPPRDRTHFKHFFLDVKCTLLIQGTLTSALFVLPVT